MKTCEDLSIPGHDSVFVVGDLACVIDKKTSLPVPGVAPAAIQMGRYVAGVIAEEMSSSGKKPRKEFVYRDKGGMATIGRNRAVAAVGGLSVSGFPAWLIWSLVHIIPLIDFRSKMMVILTWLWSYFSLSKSARLITGRPKFKVKQVLSGPNAKKEI